MRNYSFCIVRFKKFVGVLIYVLLRLFTFSYPGRVVRRCGRNHTVSLAIYCRKSTQTWHHVCSCRKPYCNTFSFLRKEIRIRSLANEHFHHNAEEVGTVPNFDDDIHAEVGKNNIEKNETAHNVSGKNILHFYFIVAFVIMPFMLGCLIMWGAVSKRYGCFY
ncbi:unnamed protein product [Soboliphyme baturini]|uniref:FLYWCH-type domain-containing protein n=1 Tax=Soboliphyme baturini TaxID=241478 RepID=A0A183IVT0_9BILA|nr:unnamed protein product [Soboliphyme baturini]